MNTNLSEPVVSPYAPTTPIPYERFGFGWGAVLAGLAIAIALNVFFAEIGLGMNLGIIDSESSGGAIVIFNAILWVVTGLIALFAGAWVAGRMSSARNRSEGSLHGLAVWGAGAVAMLVLAFVAAGVVGTGMLHLVGKGIEGVGSAAQVAMPSWDGIRNDLEGAIDRQDTDAAGATGSSALAQDSRLVDRSRLFELSERHFAVESAAPLAAGERDELVQLIAGQAGISQEAAGKTLAQWDKVWGNTVQSYEAAKAQAVEVADTARRMAMAASGWAAVAMVLGAVAAGAGGALGAISRLRLRSEWIGSSVPLTTSRRDEVAPRSRVDSFAGATADLRG